MWNSRKPATTTTWLKTQTRALDPAFSEHDYGVGGFRDFLALFPDVVHPVGTSSNDITVAAAPAAAPPPACGDGTPMEPR
ncbi:hypothetical protein [Frankia sp. Cr1]|uniref:hypothetical protein n=1 Tax=Frankia sp. Cr1 TaxID=3073931 RepID=UPI002AD44980|nr:hypothetical protein [Frankia sp. Cr1]